ncbi:MAG: putative proteasome accessory factor [Actinomycetota bacterium]
MHQLERVTNLLTLLLSARRHVTFEEIRNELRGQYPESKEAARAAFERDKAILRDEGIPIDQVTLSGQQAGQTGYRVLRSAYEIEDFGLTPDETEALRLAIGTIRLGTTWANEALWKVDLGPGETSFDQGSTAVTVELPTDDRLPRIHRAITERRRIDFSYRDRPRRLEPWGILARDGWWYVIGFDLDYGERRTYRVDRMEGAVSLGSDADREVPADFDARSVFPTDPKLLPDAVDVGSDVAIVRIDASDVGVVIAQYGDSAIVARHDDGSVDVEIPCSNVRNFVHWLLGFVERAEVIEPPALRDLVVEWLVEMAGRS